MSTIAQSLSPSLAHVGTERYDRLRAAAVPDQHPAMIVDARSATDLCAAVLAAHTGRLPLAIRSTGHGSLVSADDAVLLSTAGMTGVVIDRRPAIARIQPGTRWSAVIAAAAPYGLAPPSGDHPGVGVVGYTLGGGVGWLSRRYGYAADNLVAVDLVTADGELRRASAVDHPDLFWAVRGGGGNFGVVAALEIRLAPVDQVVTGTIEIDIDRAAAALRWFADHSDQVPDSLTLAPVLRRSSTAHDGRPGLTIGVVDSGAVPAATAASLRPLTAAVGGRSEAMITTGLSSRAYGDIAIPGVRPRGFEMYDRLTDDVIMTAVRSVAGGDAAALEFRHWGGATAHPAVGPGDPEPGPAGHRDVPFSIKMDADHDTVAALAEHATGTTFLNFAGDPRRTRSAYRASDYDRLRRVKREWDPDNLFRVNHNIPPG